MKNRGPTGSPAFLPKKLFWAKPKKWLDSRGSCGSHTKKPLFSSIFPARTPVFLHFRSIRIMEEFSSSTLAVLYGVASHGSSKMLELFIEISLEVMDVKYTNTSVKGDDILEIFSKKIDRSEIFELLKEYFSNATKREFTSIVPTGNSWTTLLAPFIWTWIHVVCIHLDLNESVEIKLRFINCIQSLILCRDCLRHYISSMSNIIDAVSKNTSLSNVFLSLHTHIANTRGVEKFHYDYALVDEKYKKMYYEMWSKILLSH